MGQGRIVQYVLYSDDILDRSYDKHDLSAYANSFTQSQFNFEEPKQFHAPLKMLSL